MTLFRTAVVVAVLIAMSIVAVGDAGRTDAGVAGFTVDTALDDPDVLPGDSQCYTGEVPGCSLRAAIQELNAMGGSHTITVPAGTYSISFPGTGEDAAATGDLDLTAMGLTINGAGESVRRSFKGARVRTASSTSSAGRTRSTASRFRMVRVTEAMVVVSAWLRGQS